MKALLWGKVRKTTAVIGCCGICNVSSAQGDRVFIFAAEPDGQQWNEVTEICLSCALSIARETPLPERAT